MSLLAAILWALFFTAMSALAVATLLLEPNGPSPRSDDSRQEETP